MTFFRAAAVLAIFWIFASAEAAIPVKGLGLDCAFQTSKSTIQPVKLWYGVERPGQPKTPQFTDLAKLFVLKGTSAGTNLTFHVVDDWPTRFTVNYFERDKGTSPLALFVVHGDGKLGTDFIAEIAQFEPNAPAGGRMKPTNRFYGACTVLPDLTWEIFRASSNQ